MTVIRLVLVVERPLLADVLRTQLANQRDLRIEAQTADHLEAALALRKLLARRSKSTDDPVVVICLVATETASPAVCGRLIQEFPEVRVVTICADSGKVQSHRGSIAVEELPCSVDDFIQGLRASLIDQNSGTPE